jgi:hypothetical protein
MPVVTVRGSTVVGVVVERHATQHTGPIDRSPLRFEIRPVSHSKDQGASDAAPQMPKTQPEVSAAPRLAKRKKAEGSKRRRDQGDKVLRGPRRTNTSVEVTVRRTPAATARGPTVDGAEVERPTTQHTGPMGAPHRILSIPCILSPIAILTPLEHVPEQVHQTLFPWGQFARDRVGVRG